MAFSENMRRLRVEKGLSQTELSEAAHVSQPLIAQFEANVKIPSAPVALAIAKRLGTTFEELVK